MLRGLMNRIRGRNLWEESVLQRQKFTPDINWISQKESHLLFVYDGMKKGFPLNSTLNDSPYICPGMSAKDTFVMWLRPDTGNGTQIRALASQCAAPDPDDRFEYPGQPWPGNIKGQIFQVYTEDLFDLDQILQNRLYYQRRRIDIRLPWRGESWTKVKHPDPSKRWQRMDEPQTVRAYTYLVPSEVVEDEKNNVVLARRFNPARRPLNQHEVNITRYYEYTHLDLNGK